MRPLFFLLVTLTNTLAITDYCGPGPVTFSAEAYVNECCRQHDYDYERISGWLIWMPFVRTKADIKFCKCLFENVSAHGLLKCFAVMSVTIFG